MKYIILIITILVSQATIFANKQHITIEVQELTIDTNNKIDKQSQEKILQETKYIIDAIKIQGVKIVSANTTDSYEARYNNNQELDYIFNSHLSIIDNAIIFSAKIVDLNTALVAESKNIGFAGLDKNINLEMMLVYILEVIESTSKEVIFKCYSK